MIVKIVLKQSAWLEELYDRYAAAWNRLHGRVEYKDLKQVVSRADRASDDEALWYASPNFGHHNSGITLDQIDIKELVEVEKNTPDHFGIVPNNVLFFFRRIHVLDDQNFKDDLIKRQTLLLASRETDERNRKAKYDCECQDRIDKTLAIFNG
jgi:hypothetical protein